MKRTLYLLRHAKSSWDDPSILDRDRPLAPRGFRTCELVAEYLRGHEITPWLVLCSSSTRTRQTLEGVSAGFSYPVAALIEHGLYGATAAELLDRLRVVDGSIASVMLIGHNPAIQELAIDLVRPAVPGDALRDKFPTGGLATLELASTWTALASGSATLTAFITPRQLKDPGSPERSRRDSVR